jgi:hypothetical protein
MRDGAYVLCRKLANAFSYTYKCTSLQITNKTSHDATSADHNMLGKDLDILKDKLQFNQYIGLASVVHKASARARLRALKYSFFFGDSSVQIKAFL